MRINHRVASSAISAENMLMATTIGELEKGVLALRRAKPTDAQE
jgi:hypothetical protein